MSNLNILCHQNLNGIYSYRCIHDLIISSLFMNKLADISYYHESVNIKLINHSRSYIVVTCISYCIAPAVKHVFQKLNLKIYNFFNQIAKNYNKKGIKKES